MCGLEVCVCVCSIIHLIKLFLLKLNFIIHFFLWPFFVGCERVCVCAPIAALSSRYRAHLGADTSCILWARFFSLWITINKIKLNNYSAHLRQLNRISTVRFGQSVDLRNLTKE